MLVPGFNRRGETRASDSEVGMLDVSANALAVLILATMLVISVASPPLLRGELREDAVPSLFYPAPLDGTLPPHSRYMVVLQQGLLELDLNAFAVELAAGGASATTAQGTAVLVTDRRMYRDLNDYRLRLQLDWGAIAALAAPLDEDGASREAQSAGQLFQDSNTASTYLVSPQAMDAFSGLYWKLREAQVPIRWANLQEGQTLVLSRGAENFERRARQWQ